MASDAELSLFIAFLSMKLSFQNWLFLNSGFVLYDQQEKHSFSYQVFDVRGPFEVLNILREFIFSENCLSCMLEEQFYTEESKHGTLSDFSVASGLSFQKWILKCHDAIITPKPKFQIKPCCIVAIIQDVGLKSYIYQMCGQVISSQLPGFTIHHATLLVLFDYEAGQKWCKKMVT